MSRCYICNRCGKKFDTLDEINGFHENGVFGYGSKNDGMEFQIDLCLDCIDEIVSEFKIPASTAMSLEEWKKLQSDFTVRERIITKRDGV